MIQCKSDNERQQAIEDNNLSLSITEKRIWDMWRRWRMSEKKLYPWDYITKGVVYADDMINLECMEAIVSKLEREQEEYQQRLEQSRANRPNPNVRSLI